MIKFLSECISTYSTGVTGKVGFVLDFYNKVAIWRTCPLHNTRSCCTFIIAYIFLIQIIPEVKELQTLIFLCGNNFLKQFWLTVLINIIWTKTLLFSTWHITVSTRIKWSKWTIPQNMLTKILPRLTLWPPKTLHTCVKIDTALSTD